MSARLTLATAKRVLQQVRVDHRTLAMLIAVPCVLIGLLAWIFNGTQVFDRIGAPLLGVFPFVVMFLVTSVATLRERSSGTLERLLSTPLGKGDFLGGYALAFGALAVVQALVATGFAIWVCGLDVAGRVARHEPAHDVPAQRCPFDQITHPRALGQLQQPLAQYAACIQHAFLRMPYPTSVGTRLIPAQGRPNGASPRVRVRGCDVGA